MRQRSFNIYDIHTPRSIVNRAPIFRRNDQWISRRIYFGMCTKMISLVSVNPDGAHGQVCVVVPSEGNNGDTTQTRNLEGLAQKLTVAKPDFDCAGEHSRALTNSRYDEMWLFMLDRVLRVCHIFGGPKRGPVCPPRKAMSAFCFRKRHSMQICRI
jgi:hypothetical protein